MDIIDNLDRRILNIVLRDARVSSKDIAADCGISRAAVSNRLNRLFDNKIVIGSGCNVDHKRIGLNTCTYIGVKLQKGSMYRKVVNELEEMPEVVECHFTTGPYSMLIKVYARDNHHLMELLSNDIQQIPGVAGTETLISLEQSINRPITLREGSEK